MFDKTITRADMIRCALCADAPCSAACGKLDPAGLLRSIWFENEKTATIRLGEAVPCLDCPAPCEDACLRAHQVPIRSLMTRLHDEVRPQLEATMPTDESLLQTDICGVPLENPFLLSSSVVGSTYDMCARAFDAGWAGVSFKTICNFDHSVAENMSIFRRLRENYPTKFILASIMGQNEAEWEMLARLCEENGASAVELNFSCPNMADDGLGSDIGQVPALVELFTAAARRGTKLPILAKLTPNVDKMSPAAEAAKRGGADGIAAINTIKSITGVNPLTFVPAPAVHGMSAFGGYSGCAVKPIALRFIAELGKNPALAGMHISGMGGIETWRDAVEFLTLGAQSLQVTTAIMQYGYRIIDDLKAGLLLFLAECGYSSVKELTALALDSVSETTDVLERDTILFPKFHPDKCIGCGRCAISCSDGGHQAITMSAARRPMINLRRCVGCHLCVLVCPQRAIRPSRKRISKR